MSETHRGWTRHRSGLMTKVVGGGVNTATLRVERITTAGGNASSSPTPWFASVSTMKGETRHATMKEAQTTATRLGKRTGSLPPSSIPPPKAFRKTPKPSRGISP